jgi:hypothetical protein
MMQNWRDDLRLFVHLYRPFGAKTSVRFCLPIAPKLKVHQLFIAEETKFDKNSSVSLKITVAGKGHYINYFLYYLRRPHLHVFSAAPHFRNRGYQSRWTTGVAINPGI